MRGLFIVGPSALILGGCAGLEFADSYDPHSLSYFEPVPYVMMSHDKDCVATSAPVTLPGKKRSIKLISGYGSADLSVTLENGLIKSVGQKTDTKIPETITAVTGALKTLTEAPASCDRTKDGLYRIKDDGSIDTVRVLPL